MYSIASPCMTTLVFIPRKWPVSLARQRSRLSKIEVRGLLGLTGTYRILAFFTNQLNVELYPRDLLGTGIRGNILGASY